MEESSNDTEGIGAKLARSVRQAPPAGVVSIYLFGSQAEGRAHRESDVDLAVLLDFDVYPTTRERFEERLRLSSRFAAGLGGLMADVVVLNDCPPGLARRAVTVGERIYCSDPELDHAFVRDAQLRAADLAPFLERMRRLKLEAISR
ncbi:MAG: type VII toxin-antitoxin system MntA family adenylyltransferase antitoxin [Candidatus Binatia bacterium]